MDWIANQAQERRWIDEARIHRLKQIKNAHDATRFSHDFGVRFSDVKPVYAVRREAWEKPQASNGPTQPGIQSDGLEWHEFPQVQQVVA